jgi:pimeloyl-ACP methyl ester carboxylesterase
MRLGLLGGKPFRPAPTLFVFANNIEQTLTNDGFVQVGHILERSGFIIVSVDVPGHGAERKHDEPEGIEAWRARLELGDVFLPAYLARVSSVLDFLIQSRYTDPASVSACGTSRGGFIAIHFAARDARVKRVAAFAPVTNLAVLREFQGMADKSLLEGISLSHMADRLVGRPVWLTIGNCDDRVGTDETITFMKEVVAASVARNRTPTIELHIKPSNGHSAPARAHEDAAAWLLSTEP